MTLIDSLKSFFKKGKVKVGMGNYLKTITDHPNINLPPSEIWRIQEDLRYYRNDMKNVHYYNTYNQKKERKPHTLALTKQMSRQLASLVFNEGMTISIQPHADEQGTTVDQGDDMLDQFIKKVLADNNFNQNYEENLELGLTARRNNVHWFALNIRTGFTSSWMRTHESHSHTELLHPICS